MYIYVYIYIYIYTCIYVASMFGSCRDWLQRKREYSEHFVIDVFCIYRIDI